MTFGIEITSPPIQRIVRLYPCWYMSEREKELDAMTNFMYKLKAAESRRQLHQQD